jgi:hypothetical protein
MRRDLLKNEWQSATRGLALIVVGTVLLTAAAVAAPLSVGAAGARDGGLPLVLVQAVPTMDEAYIRAAQKELRGHGYFAGPVDSVYGPQTRAAVCAYQRDAGLPVTGVADQALVDHLMFAQPKVTRFAVPAPSPILEIQRDLAKRGYYLGAVDGIAGPQTRDAIQRFLADARLTAVLPEPTARLRDLVRETPPEVTAR